MSIIETVKKAGTSVKNRCAKIGNYVNKNADIIVPIVFVGGMVGLSVFASIMQAKEDAEAAKFLEERKEELQNQYDELYKPNYEEFMKFAKTFDMQPGQVLTLGYFVHDDRPPEHYVKQKVVTDVGYINSKDWI